MHVLCEPRVCKRIMHPARLTSHEQSFLCGVQGKHRGQGASQEMSGGGDQTAHRGFIDGVQDEQLSVSLQHESLLRRSIAPSEGQINTYTFNSVLYRLERITILYRFPGNFLNLRIRPKGSDHHTSPWMKRGNDDNNTDDNIEGRSGGSIEIQSRCVLPGPAGKPLI